MSSQGKSVIIVVTKKGCSRCDTFTRSHLPSISKQLKDSINVTIIETSDSRLCPEFLDPYVRNFPTLLMCSWNEFQNFFHSDGRLKSNDRRRFNCKVFGLDDSGYRVFDSIADVYNPVVVCVDWARTTDTKLRRGGY